MKKIITYDSTLRDGGQAQGISLSLDDKIKIAERLDRFGIDIIEGGFPASNPKDRAFFEYVKLHPFKHALLAGFGTTCKKNTKAQDDEGLKALAQCGAPIVTLVGKTWDLHVEKTLLTSLDENVRMIFDSVEYLSKAGLVVIFDAEHYFDGFKSNKKYALECISAALKAGASSIDLCDTNGGTLPHDVAQIVAETIKQVRASDNGLFAYNQGGKADSVDTKNLDARDVLEIQNIISPRIGIHAHNDCACAVANSLAAVQAGATQVQGTINGYGERVGNANLLTVIANLELKMGYQCIPTGKLRQLKRVASYVADVCNYTISAHEPYVGTSAFSHKGGLHASAIARFSGAYEHVSPRDVGNSSDMIVSELSGKASLIAKASLLNIDLEKYPEHIQAILDDIKDKEAKGYSFEVAEGSLALLIHQHISSLKPHFSLESFRVIVDDREDKGALAKDAQSEATIKMHVMNTRTIATGEGVGPVGALASALKLALKDSYPEVDDMHLIDFKVRLLDESTGTDAVTRVTITTRDERGTWTTVGVSENIIEASWNALVESIEYGLLRREQAQLPQ